MSMRRSVAILSPRGRKRWKQALYIAVYASCLRSSFHEYSMDESSCYRM